MKRRDFLKLTGSVGAGVIGGLMPALELHATHSPDDYTGPLMLIVEANGGWDPTSLCDPKGNINAADPVNNFLASDITTMTGTTGTDVGDEIFYAPPAPIYDVGGANFDANLFSNQTFFTSHASRLLIINGINNRTVAHGPGRMYAMSGELAKPSYPNFGALLAGTAGSRRAIPFISNGGYDETAGMVAPTRLNNNGIRALYEIAYPERITPDRAGDGTYFSAEVQDLITEARDTRHAQLVADQRLLRLQQSLGGLIAARQDPGHLREMTVDLETRLELPAATFNGRNRARDLYRQGRIALSAYETGVTAAAHLRIGGYDTHGDHDQRHYPRLMDLLMGVDAIIQEINARGLQDRVVIMIASDFGRTNRYNSDDGKDHWRVTSSMFWAAPSIITGNRCIGATDVDHRSLTISPQQAASTGSNIIITPAHIHNALRRLFGIDNVVPINLRLAAGEVSDNLDLFGKEGAF